MINKLVEKAIEIEASTDANLGGAAVQVSNSLTNEEKIELYRQYANRKAERKERIINRSKLKGRDGQRAMNVIVDFANSLIENKVLEAGRK